MKTRMSVVDVRAMVYDLRLRALGMRLVNVYDINARTYLFKLALPGREKIVLLMESGIRFHTTEFSREKSNIPSGFCMKLRKHIRTRRVEEICQLGMDRVVDFKFGSGASACHIILELYAAGNIILTDSNFKILSLLRTHKYEQDVRCAVGEVYPVSYAAANIDIIQGIEGAPATSTSGVEAVPETDGLGEAEKDAEEEDEAQNQNGDTLPPLGSLTGQLLRAWLARRVQQQQEEDQQQQSELQLEKESGGKGGGKKAKKQTLRQVLTSKGGNAAAALGPVLVEHCLALAGAKGNAKLGAGGGGDGGEGVLDGVLSEEQADVLVGSMQEAAKMLRDMGRAGRLQTEGGGGGGGARSHNRSSSSRDGRGERQSSSGEGGRGRGGGRA